MRFRAILLAAGLVGLALSASGPNTVNLDFDGEGKGSLPLGWVAGVTGKGSPRWVILNGAGAPSQPNVLAQIGQGAFPFCVDASSALRDGFAAVKFQVLMGKEEQVGGLVWRFLDKGNYYVAGADTLHGKLVLCRMQNGARKELEEVEAKVEPVAWHSFRVDFKGAGFAVTYDGKRVLEAKDDAFAGPGAVGVWTEADSVVYFDDFEYGPPPP